MTMNVNNNAVPCDCLNRCGDDPWLAKGKAEPCDASKKETARMAELLHPDNLAVDRFAAVMKEKLAMARAKGRGGWDDPAQCTVEHLSNLLRAHVGKGDPVDVGNFCMMLQQRGAGICARPVEDALYIAFSSDGREHIRFWTRNAAHAAEFLKETECEVHYFSTTTRTGDLTAAVDAAMIEMANIHPPLRRSECERLIRAALTAPQIDQHSDQAKKLNYQAQKFHGGPQSVESEAIVSEQAEKPAAAQFRGTEGKGSAK